MFDPDDNYEVEMAEGNDADAIFVLTNGIATEVEVPDDEDDTAQ